MTPAASCRSTYHPQPLTSGEPSWSQPWEAGFTLHRTVRTVPDAAARMIVPRGAARSTPLCVGLSGVWKPEITGASTGAIHPDWLGAPPHWSGPMVTAGEGP